jgi:hypothetical protein
MTSREKNDLRLISIDIGFTLLALDKKEPDEEIKECAKIIKQGVDKFLYPEEEI